VLAPPSKLLLIFQKIVALILISRPEPLDFCAEKKYVDELYGEDENFASEEAEIVDPVSFMHILLEVFLCSNLGTRTLRYSRVG
jgi:hypothetical protein